MKGWPLETSPIVPPNSDPGDAKYVSRFEPGKAMKSDEGRWTLCYGSGEWEPAWLAVAEAAGPTRTALRGPNQEWTEL